MKISQAPPGSAQNLYLVVSDIAAARDQLAARGVAILFASSELEEVIGLSDRVLVMHEGRLAADLPRTRATEETVMAAATGRGKSAA